MEVTLNVNWCCDPVPEVCRANPALGSEEDCARQDCGRCNRRFQGRYHKADYYQTARLLGKAHVMLDPDDRSPPVTKNPISSKYLYVNSTRLVVEVLEAYRQATKGVRASGEEPFEAQRLCC